MQTGVVQMRFLRLNSKFVKQNVTFSCQPNSHQGFNERDIKFLADSRRQSFLGTLLDCEVRQLYLNDNGLHCCSFNFIIPPFCLCLAVRVTGYRPSGVCVPVWDWRPGTFTNQRSGFIWPQWRNRTVSVYCRTRLLQLKHKRSLI